MNLSKRLSFAHTRETLEVYLNTRWGILLELLIVVMVIYSRLIEPYGTLLIGWTSLWIRKKNWDNLGLKKPESWKRVILLTVFATTVLLAISVTLTPLLERFTGVPIDDTVFQMLKGNYIFLYILLALVWSSAGFGEEMAYRGYLLTRLQELIGNQPYTKIISLIICGALFGLPHLYYGLTGVIQTGLLGIFFGILYLYKGNLWLPILTHGLYDTIALILNFFYF